MNKTIIIGFFILISPPIFGQWNVSFSGGLNSSTSQFENISEIMPKSKLDYFIGLGPAYQINQRTYVQLDIQFSLKGYQSDFDLSSSKQRYFYLDFLPEIEYKLLPFISLGTGLNYGIRLKETFLDEHMDWNVSPNSVAVKPTDLGLTGFLKVSSKQWFGIIRYNHGLKNITNLTFTDAQGEVITNIKQLNRNLQIGIGYRLPFEKE